VIRALCPPFFCHDAAAWQKVSVLVHMTLV
jgi:hypothetical protein